jgi:hypothetical protein
MATTIAVVGVAASAGAAAYSASQQGGKGGGGAPSVAAPTNVERIFNRGTADMLDEERRIMEDSLAQANFMQPELYKLLGYEPIYDEAQADITPLANRADELNAQLNGSIRALNTVRAAKGPKAKREAARAAGYMNVNALKKARKDLMRQKELADRELSAAQTTGRRVVGLKKLEQSGDPTQSQGDLYRMAFDLQNQTLVNALQGKEPVDATLKTAFEEKEKALRERLRRTLGSDYETSSAGMEAIANFDRERSEAFKQFNQELVRSFSSMTESRAASLSDLTSARMQQLLFPSNAQAARALTLGQAASDRQQVSDLRQRERGLQFEGKKAKYEADRARSEARTQAISSLIGSVGGGLSGAAGSAGSFAGASAAPTTVDVPEYGAGPHASGYRF